MKGRRKLSAHVLCELGAPRVVQSPLLATAQELEAQPVNLLKEHQNRTTRCGTFLTTRVSQSLAPAPQSLELVFVQTHPD